jgi:hypothetical protein
VTTAERLARLEGSLEQYGKRLDTLERTVERLTWGMLSAAGAALVAALSVLGKILIGGNP